MLMSYYVAVFTSENRDDISTSTRQKIMYKRLTLYIDNNGILSEHQYGFRSKSSTNHAIIELIDKVTKAIESNENTVGIFSRLVKSL